jgi:hypothetical protein
MALGSLGVLLVGYVLVLEASERGLLPTLRLPSFSAGPPPSHSSLPACGTGPLFSVPPVAADALAAIVPLGHVVPSAHVFPTAQLNLKLARDANGVVVPAPIVAPSALRITSVGRKEEFFGDESEPRFVDYTLYFEACADVSGYFMLVQSLPESLKRAVGEFSTRRCERYETGGSRFRFCGKDLAIDVPAGAPLGTAGRVPGAELPGGRPDFGADLIDWGLRDQRRPAGTLANPARPSDQDLVHAACALDYLAPAPRAAYVEKLGLPGGPRSKSGACGQPVQDQVGTARGRWFRAGAPERPEDAHLALVDDDLDPARAVISLGNGLAPTVASQGISFSRRAEGSVNLDFASLRAPGSACYEGLVGSGPNPFSGVMRIRLEADRLVLSAYPGVPDCAHVPQEPAPAPAEAQYRR